MTPTRILPLSIALAVTHATGCTDAGCPEGSAEVDGICMEQEPDATTSSEASGDPDAGTVDADAAPGERGDEGGDADDGGVEADGAARGARDPSDGGSPATGDAAAGPITCDDLECGESAHCESVEGTATCVCDAGYAGDDCDDVDECSDDTDDCDENASCQNTDGSFTCTCNAGYDGDGTTCSDVDECSDDTDDCDENASCDNTAGSFTCTCDVGYEGDGKSCTENPCEPRANPCDTGTTSCRDDGGTAVCDCHSGRGRCDGDDFACDTNLTNDDDHCGQCDYACAGSLSCGASECEQAVVGLGLGSSHSCAIEDDGDMLCWGENIDELLQRGASTVSPWEPDAVVLGRAALLAAGALRSCAVMLDERLLCWGDNRFRHIDPAAVDFGVFELESSASEIDQLAIGAFHTCFRNNSGLVRCWGFNNTSQLGASGSSTRSFDTAETPVASNALDITATLEGTCALMSTGHVRCWGNGSPALVEIENSANDPLDSVDDIESNGAGATMCALLGTGRVVCWGDNGLGQLGNPANEDAFVDHAIVVTDEDSVPLTNAVEIAVGVEHACARRADGTVVCWGRRDRLGTGDSGGAARRFFTPVTGIDDALEIAAGAQHTCVRRGSGQVQCWGSNSEGQLSLNPVLYTDALLPANVVGLP